MAFSFGFNKQKVLSAAEKFVQQGKLQNAIAEYNKVLKHDAKDLTVNNTIGDLYARLGDSAKAIECFKTVGDAYAAQGFTVKGIAMYKKITKLQPSVDGSLKLAELYTQQGLFNDARAQYLQVAEDFMKNGDLDQAVRLFQKVLEMDPENVPMRIKLAEVYVRLDKKKQAWEIFSAAAESLRARGSLVAAEDVLKRMLVLDPGNSYVLLLRGRSALESDDPKSAITYLEKAADLDSQPEGLRDLLKAYLQIGALPKAAPIAEKLLTVHNDPEGLFLLAEGCARLGQNREALEVYNRHADRLLATDSTKLLASLHSMISHVRDDSGALDALLQLLNKAGENTHVNEVTELLAHASVKDGNLARACDLYQMLATTEPQNLVHTQNYQQVVARMEGGSPAIGITAEEGAVIVEELEATAPVIDQSYPDQVAIAIRSAVTDADLFLSYNLPEKAIVPLLGALPQAPRDARLNQRLAGLHTRFQRFTEAAVCCRTLEGVYHDAGCPDEAMRYGELAARYEKSADAARLVSTPSVSAMPVSTPVAPTPSSTSARPARRSAPASPSPWPTAAASESSREIAAASRPEFAVHEMTLHAPSGAAELSSSSEISSQVSSEVSSEFSAEFSADASADLSSEWEHSLSGNQETPTAEPPVSIEVVGEGGLDASDNPEIAETAEEIRFYLGHFMTDQARAGMEKLASLTSDARILDPLRAAIESAGQPDEPEPEITEINADEPADFEITLELPQPPEIITTPVQMIGSDQPNPVEIQGEVAARQSPEPVGAEPHFAEPIHAEPHFAEPIHAGPHYAEPHRAEPHRAEPQHAEPHHADPHQAEPAFAESSTADPGELTTFVADLEASLGDSFPQAPPAAAPLPVSQRATTLPNWPVAPAPSTSRMPEPAHEPVASTSAAYVPSANAEPEFGIPTGPASVPAIAAATGSAGTAAAPALAAAPPPATTAPSMSYGPSALRPLGAGAQAMHPSGSVDLSEMFGELKQELEEEVMAGDDDPETHYNLGVAFREMGLLDEAIAELQKVCTAIDRGKAFTQPVQTYTWLAQCFIDKGVPEAAIRWYEKALGITGLDDETRLAINYELGSASETAQDKPAALRYFTNVYGANIDYRDVAERIQALKS
jgi:tetratricopeptide (TPR) repeat protein